MLGQQEIIQRLVLHEGCMLVPYKCPAGFLTIGVGRNIEKNPLTSEEKKVCGDYMNGITKNAAFYLLRNDIEKVCKDLMKNIPWWKNLDNERQYALLDMCFQLGINGLLRFRKMLSAMGVGNWQQAAEECLNSNYARQTPKRAKRIAETIRTGRFII
jgi:lysozyme